MGALTKKDKKKSLTPKQMKALTVLATGGTWAKAAEAAGVGKTTISKWVRLNEFHRELTKAMERMRYAFESRAIAAGQDAIAVAHNELKHKDADIKLKASNILVGAAVRLGSRYKELEVSGALPAPQPMIIFPDNTRMPWNAKPVDVIVDVKAKELPEKIDEEEEDGD